MLYVHILISYSHTNDIRIPATVMLFVTSKYIIYIIAGKSFEIATQPLKILSLAFLFAVIGGALAYCV